MSPVHSVTRLPGSYPPQPSPHEEREQARRLVLNRALFSSRAELQVKTTGINYAPQRTPSPRWERAGVRGKGPLTRSIALVSSSGSGSPIFGPPHLLLITPRPVGSIERADTFAVNAATAARQREAKN